MSAAGGGIDARLHIGRFCVACGALARCLTAVVPEICDRMFSNIAREMIDGAAPQAGDAASKGVWLREASGIVPGVEPGYIFIGPPGSPHFFTREKPEGIADAEMATIEEAPPGRLIAEMKAFLENARRLEAGEAIQVRGFGGEITLTCPAELMPRVIEARGLLENALAAIDGKNAAAALRTSAAGYIGLIGKAKAAEAAEIASRPIAGMRNSYAADAGLASLALLRPALARALPADGSADRLIHMSFESLGAGGDPERMLGQIIRDYAKGGQAALLTSWLDDAILAAREDVETAKNARTIDAHGDALYRAAASSYTARAVAQVLIEMVPPEQWPAGTTRDMLDGYVDQAEEKTVRAAHALVISAINAGSGLALLRHRAAVKAQGPDKADELIEQYYFYPRCDLNLLADP